MKVAFWSNTYDHARVSYHLAAISIAGVMRFPYSIAVLENDLHENNLGKAYLGTRQQNILKEAGSHYYDGGGIEGLLRCIYRGRDAPGVLQSYIKEVIRSHLYYIPQGRYINNEVFDYEFSLNSDIMFRWLEQTFDLCFIDTAPLTLNSKEILETADLIVVNLYQNRTFLDDFFEQYSSLLSKAVFLIGNYSSQSILGYKQISKLYDIPVDTITPIPYNETFSSAYMNARAVEFITGCYQCKKENPNYPFIYSIRRAASIIINEAMIRKSKRKLCLK